MNVNMFGNNDTIRTDKNLKKYDPKEIRLMKGHYQNRLLIFGVMLIGFSIYSLQTVFTFKSSLAQIKGTLRSADTYVTNVTDRRGYESKKSELIFYINERKQRFYLAENIGDEWRNEKYATIIKGLERADSITVWVKKSEFDAYEPKVFQIDNEKETLLDFEMVRDEERPIAAFMLLLGLCSIVVFLWVRFPDEFKKILETNERKP